jgi:succinyl-CoA synthetase beta subunit
VVEAARKTNMKLPVVLRLEGTNVTEGKKILNDSGLNFVVTDTLKDAAVKVVSAARGTLGVTEWR